MHVLEHVCFVYLICTYVSCRVPLAAEKNCRACARLKISMSTLQVSVPGFGDLISFFCLVEALPLASSPSFFWCWLQRGRETNFDCSSLTLMI